MPDQTSEATETDTAEAVPAADAAEMGAVSAEVDERADAAAPRSRRRRVRRNDWRQGGSTVVRWREGLLAIALFSLGAGLLGSAAIGVVLPGATVLAAVVLWIALAVPVVWGFARSRPAGLLRFRPVDLLFGIALGVMIRFIQGGVAASGGDTAFPSYAVFDGQLPSTWLIVDGFGAVLIAPVLEELFFHGVVLVALYTVLRRPVGKLAAGIGALLVTTGAFVLVHGLAGALGIDAIVGLVLVAGVGGALVLLTGRIWAAVLLHVTYNAVFVALALVGTLFG